VDEGMHNFCVFSTEVDGQDEVLEANSGLGLALNVGPKSAKQIK
jgi:hypothetical protein